MSDVKSLALGFAILAIAAPSILADSIRSQASRHLPASSPPEAEPITLVYAPSPVRQVGAENLALAGGQAPFGNGGGQPSTATPSAGLSLGVFGGTSPSNFAGIGSGPWVAPVATPSTPAPASNASAPEALINFGNGPFPEASSLTTGTPQAFTASPAFTHFFGAGGPSTADVANFEAEVLSTIKSTYANAGLAISLTTDPNAGAAHTMSVVSGASYTANPGAIGITDVGNSGFSFIDKFGSAATVDDLAEAVGHNLAHELMHAFGIANHPEQTGPYVDAATTTMQALEDPSTGFSPAAASLLSTLDFHAVGDSVTSGAQKIDGDQVLIGAPAFVPEPATLTAWLALGGLLALRGRRRRRGP